VKYIGVPLHLVDEFEVKVATVDQVYFEELYILSQEVPDFCSVAVVLEPSLQVLLELTIEQIDLLDIQEEFAMLFLRQEHFLP
jgi:hypothetical protein